jgi:hypothetical protein
VRLTEEHAALVKGLLMRGEKQHDIAGYFGVNGGRVAEIAKGHRYPDVRPAPRADLPTPAQMIPWGFIMAEARKALQVARMALASGEARLDEIEGKLLAAAEIERTARKRRTRQ